MSHLKALIFVALVCGVLGSQSAKAEDTLELVHVIFRDGNRTPSKFWESNPYNNESYYEPYGFGELTNEGKNTEYNLGQALRKRYGEFLGEKLDIDAYEAWAAHSDRTKTSLELVLAGLFPPSGPTVWNPDLLWQPTPYNSLPEEQDKELSSYACPTVLPLIYGNDEIMERLKSYDLLMDVIGIGIGIGGPADYLDALDIYLTLVIQEHLGLELEAWAKAVYPEPYRTYYADFYYIETSTLELKRILGGYLLRKILTDTQNKIYGTSAEKKIYLYSGHESSVAFTLVTLNTYNVTDCPPFGSYILFELHKIDGVYGIKMFYEDLKTDEPQITILPGCEEFCPLDQFLKLTANLIPSDAECYGDE